MHLINSIVSFFRLIRTVNLLFILLTQLLFHFCIILPAYKQLSNIAPRLNETNFYLLVLASILIAAGGYIINDYFDINIDRVNKPTRMVVGKLISRRWAMFFHLLLSVLGLLLTAIVSRFLDNLLLLLLNIIAVILLWFYSTLFKKKVLIGNIIIATLSAWVVFVLYIAELQLDFNGFVLLNNPASIKIYKLAVIYSGFAFIISLIREIVKDMEDIEGDRKYAAETMPIVWGNLATKMFVSVWTVVLTGMLFFMMVFAFLKNWYFLSGYLLLFLIFPIFNILSAIFSASITSDFSRLSLKIKLFMFFGIMSMIIYHYHV